MRVQALWLIAVSDDEDVFLVGDFDVRSTFAGNKSESGGEERNDSEHGGLAEG